MQAKEIKNGSIVNYQEAPVIIESISVQSPSARGAATLYKFRGRNLMTKQKVDITLKGTESLDEADFQRQPVTLMYTDPDHIHLMDSETFNQYALPKEVAEHELLFLKEGQEGLLALIYNEECVALQLPGTVELKIEYCEPGVKGNSATGRTKPAKLETGHSISVPEYLGMGEMVKIDTRTGEFLGRA